MIVLKTLLGVDSVSATNDKDLSSVAGVLVFVSVDNGVLEVDGKQKAPAEISDTRVFFGSGAGVVGVGGAVNKATRRMIYNF